MATEMVPENGGSNFGVFVTRFSGGTEVGMMFQFTFEGENGGEFCTVSVEELRARARQETAHREK